MTPSGTAVVRAAVSPAEADAVRALAGRATAADGVAPFSEQALLHLADAEPREGVTHVLVGPSEALTGYAQLDRGSAELVVDPTVRRTGIGRRLLDAVEQAASAAALQIWAHGDAPAARAFAQGAGWSRARVLLQLRRSLLDPLPDPDWAEGVTVRTFRPGEDESAWLAVNNAAFASHPEQGGWTLHDVRQREQSAWFDPAGIYLAERGGELVGFHWTKVHADERPPMGEVYIVGVRPQDAGQGLGRALTLVGLRHLRDLGLREVLLYVDEDNVAAVRTYERLGFARHTTDVQYLRKAT